MQQASPQIDFNTLAAAQQDTELQTLRRSSTSLTFADVSIPGVELSLICDFSTGQSCLYVPNSFRFPVFELLHGLSHPGIRASQRLITSTYIWPSMKADIKKWVRCCLHCQCSKIQHHNKAPPSTFAVPDARFNHVHIDIVGPLPPSKGFSYR